MPLRRVARASRVLPGLLTMLLLLPAAGAAQVREPGTELTVYLATMGPGAEVWEKFGHNAIWIRDATTRSTIAYNYGIFDFYQDRFVPRLMKGDMLYSMGVDEADNEVARYAYFDRSVWAQELNLTPAQRHALREFLEWNWLPQNRDYHYDYFRDNCSTRIRDALDRALAGALGDALRGVPTGTSYRSHSLRLTAASPATYTGLMLGLGLPTDRPIDAWEEAFIPMELMRHLRDITVRDDDGNLVPLVAAEMTLVESQRPAPPADAPARVHYYLIAGLALAAGLLLLARTARSSRPARFGLAVAICFWGLVTGFFGVILSLLWLFTNHTAAYPNLNVLQTNPLGLLLAVAAPLCLLRAEHGRPSRLSRAALPLSQAVAAMSVLALLLHLFPGWTQQSWGIVALALPVHLATAVAMYHAARRGVSHPEDEPREGMAAGRGTAVAPTLPL